MSDYDEVLAQIRQAARQQPISAPSEPAGQVRFAGGKRGRPGWRDPDRPPRRGVLPPDGWADGGVFDRQF